MTKEEAIYVRKSTRKFDMSFLGAEATEEIKKGLDDYLPLDKGIPFKAFLMTIADIKTGGNWKAPYYIAFYSQPKGNYLLNAGFIAEQIALFLLSLGYGACFKLEGEVLNNPLDKAKDNPDMELVLVLGFGKPKSGEPLRDKDGFKRHRWSDSMDEDDVILHPSLLSPSAYNVQPWFFIHDGRAIDVYCKKPGFFFKKSLEKGNPLSVGMALSHLYLSNPATFSFFVQEGYYPLKGYDYSGSVMFTYSKSLNNLFH